ncbi:hypothetical protein Tco_0349198 [Tanacetum coccineum]
MWLLSDLIAVRVNAVWKQIEERKHMLGGQGNNEAGGHRHGAPVRSANSTFSGFIENATLVGTNYGHGGNVVELRRALTWWNSQVATMGLEDANQIGWTKMKRIMTEEFCPVEEVQQMEHERGFEVKDV